MQVAVVGRTFLDDRPLDQSLEIRAGNERTWLARSNW